MTHLLAMFLLSALAPAPQEAPPASEFAWVAAPTDGQDRMATVDWRNGVALAARCQADRFDLVMALPVALEGDRVEVTYALDGGEPVERLWLLADSGRAVISRLPEALARDMLSARTANLRLTDGSPPAVALNLELPGQTDALRDVMEACDVPTQRPAATSLITDAQWRRRPDGEDLVRFFPRKAWEARVDGRATAQCVVDRTGALRDCVVLDESPQGYDFGAATLLVAMERFEVEPGTIDGEASASMVNVPINWVAPPSTGRTRSSGRRD